MEGRSTGRVFGALLIAAFLGGICSQIVVSVAGGKQVEAAAPPAAPAAALTEVRATALVIVGEDGVERARLGACEGGYGLVVRDAAGVARAVLSLVNEEKGVALALHDATGLRRFYMGPGPDGGGFEVVDPRGNKRFGFGEGPDGGALQVLGPGGKTRFSVGDGLDGGGVQVFDTVGNKRFEVSEGGGWLGMSFRDVEGVERAGVRMGPDGESDFFITGGRTEWNALGPPQSD